MTEMAEAENIGGDTNFEEWLFSAIRAEIEDRLYPLLSERQLQDEGLEIAKGVFSLGIQKGHLRRMPKLPAR